MSVRNSDRRCVAGERVADLAEDTLSLRVARSGTKRPGAQ